MRAWRPAVAILCQLKPLHGANDLHKLAMTHYQCQNRQPSTVSPFLELVLPRETCGFPVSTEALERGQHQRLCHGCFDHDMPTAGPRTANRSVALPAKAGAASRPSACLQARDTRGRDRGPRGCNLGKVRFQSTRGQRAVTFHPYASWSPFVAPPVPDTARPARQPYLVGCCDCPSLWVQ